MSYIHYSLENQAFMILINNLSSGRKSKMQPLPTDSPYRIFFQAVQVWAKEAGINLAEDYGPDEITYALWALIHGMTTLRIHQLKDFEADFESVNRKTIHRFLNGMRTC
jgi:hypothetical protein